MPLFGSAEPAHQGTGPRSVNVGGRLLVGNARQHALGHVARNALYGQSKALALAISAASGHFPGALNVAAPIKLVGLGF
jgi:hypothetical protein